MAYGFSGHHNMSKTKGFYKLNNYTAITQGCAKVITYLFEIYHGRDGLESFCKKYDIDSKAMRAYLSTCNLPSEVLKLFKKINWFYESKLGHAIYIKYPVMAAKSLITTSMTLEEFAVKYKINKVIVKNFFNENYPILSQSVLNACREEGVWNECYTKTPMELRSLAKEYINQEHGGIVNYLQKINFTHHDSFFDYFIGVATPDKLEKRLKIDGFLIR